VSEWQQILVLGNRFADTVTCRSQESH